MIFPSLVYPWVCCFFLHLIRQNKTIIFFLTYVYHPLINFPSTRTIFHTPKVEEICKYIYIKKIPCVCLSWHLKMKWDVKNLKYRNIILLIYIYIYIENDFLFQNNNHIKSQKKIPNFPFGLKLPATKVILKNMYIIVHYKFTNWCIIIFFLMRCW